MKIQKNKLLKELKKNSLGMLIAIASLVFILILSNFSNFTKESFNQLENIFYDLSFQFKLLYVESSVEDSTMSSVQRDLILEDRIIIADIDERSLEQLGNYSVWPRSYHANVVNYLTEGNASAIMFDILYKNADFGERKAIETIKLLGEISPEINWLEKKDSIKSFFNYDSLLINSVKNSKNVIVSATVAPHSNYVHKSQWSKFSTPEWQNQLGLESSIPIKGINTRNVKTWDLIDNIIPELANEAKYFGLLNVRPDTDGTQRKIALVNIFPNQKINPKVKVNPRLYLSSSLLTVIHLMGITPQDLKFKSGEYIELGKPLGIYRDSITKELKTSFPNLSYDIFKSIIENKQKIKDLLNNKTNSKLVYLKSNLMIKKDNKTGKLSSNFIILNHSVIKEILKTSIDDLNKLEVGQEKRFGRKIRIPVDDQYRMNINYTGVSKVDRNKRPFKQISYYDLISKRIDPAAFTGKIFITGSTAPSLFDFISTPHEKEYPGVLIHATILENILNQNYLVNVKDEFTLLISFVWLLLLSILLIRFSPLISFIITLSSMVGYFLFSYSYFEDGLYMEMAKTEIAIILTFLGIIIMKYLIEEKEKIFLNDTFKNYISPELIDQMAENRERPALGGTESSITAYFTDIAKFSTFSEKIGSPTKLVELLNEYLTEMTDILLEHKGTLDKYEGDAIIAFFGAPAKLENNAQAAAETALKMQKAQHKLRHKWAHENKKWPEIVHQMHTRIGLNTGAIVTGNMGSKVRMNYTMMGDAVNLAARLESIAKQYGVYIMCSEGTLNLLEDNILYRPIDIIKVMGKSVAVKVYELLEFKENASDDLKLLAKKFSEALALYQDMRWAEALVLFNECVKLEPNHPERDPGSETTPSEIFINRCLSYSKNSPTDNAVWDGIYVAHSK